jgi:hypothetical protein
MTLNNVLAVFFISSGLLTVVVEFVIRAQVNRQLSPDQRIRIYDLPSPSVWLGQNGLLARHRRFYPESNLASIFRILWVLFFATFGALIIYAKTTASR